MTGSSVLAGRAAPLRKLLLGTGLASLLALTACATAAQQQVQQISSSLRDADAAMGVCVAASINKPEFALLLPHTVRPNAAPTVAQLTDEQLPTPEEARLLARRYDEINVCRQNALRTLASALPTVLPIFSDGWEKDTANTVQLVERKISWAEATRRWEALKSEARKALMAASQQYLAEMDVWHREELARRERAAAAFLQWSLEQQMINAANRPVVTNCNRFGNMVNCTTN
jgi:hypothetical protein